VDVSAEVPSPVAGFLGAATPEAWIEAAVRNLEEILLDHANCEKKAASTALALMFRYERDTELAQRMSRLAREELRHFEQVQAILSARGIPVRRLAASRYAQGLRDHVRRSEPGRLVDLLVTGAFIEARSCERFALIAPRLDADLGTFYRGLLASEARHFERYLTLARERDPEGWSARVACFRDVEARLATEPDPLLRFHSGPPERSPGRPVHRGSVSSS
jgi:tRNA-(ms[2]io[6]A)-hydroxylase